MNDLGALYTRIEADTKGLDKAESAIKSFAGKAAGYFAGIASTAALASAVKSVTLLTARYDQMGVVMNVVGKNAGYNAKQMSDYQKGLESTGISMISARENLTKMAQAQIDLTKSTELARVAQDAAKIGNINSSEAFSRMIQGIQAGEVEILRNIGLQVNFEQGYQNTAAALGKTTAQLSNQEKVMSRANETLRAGQLANGVYAASLETVSGKLGSMPRLIENIKVRSGDIFQPATVVILDKFKKSLDVLNNYLDKNAGNFKDWAASMKNVAKYLLDSEGFIKQYGGGLATLAGIITGAKVAQIAFNIVARANPYILVGGVLIAFFLKFNEALGEHGIKLKNVTTVMENFARSFSGLSAVIAGDLNLWRYISSGPEGLKKALSEIPSEIEKAKTKVIELETLLKDFENYKQPWYLPKGNDLSPNIEAIKGEIEKYKKIIEDSKLEERIKASMVDPWNSAERELQKSMNLMKGTAKRDLKIIQDEYEKHRDAIFKINDQIKQNQLSGDQLVRDLKREGMTKGAAEADLKKEAQEYVALMEKAKKTWEGLKNAKSKEDVAKKDAAFEDIMKYADVAQSKFLEMDRTSSTTKADVIKNIEGIIQAKDKALQASKQVEVTAANALITEGGTAVASQLFEDVKTKANEITAITYPKMGEAFVKVWNDGKESANLVFTNIEERAAETGKKISENIWVVPEGTTDFSDKVKALYADVDKAALEGSKETTKNIIKNNGNVDESVKKIEGVWTNVWDEASKAADESMNRMLEKIAKVKAAAASVKMPSSSSSNAYQSGGMIQRLKDGGMAVWNKMNAIKASTGRFFSGFGGGDKIPILGEAGEYMINKYKVREAGPDTAAAFNAGNWGKVIQNLLPKLSTGGPTPSVFPRQALAYGGGVQNFDPGSDQGSIRNYFIQGSLDPISVRASDKDADRLLSALQRKYRSRS